MEYISAQQAAIKWGISKRRVQVLCAENRIKDATRIGNMWVIPATAVKPTDGRIQCCHTVKAPTTRTARTALKKLTAYAYLEINTKLNDPSTAKMVFVSLFATAIFCDIQKEKSSKGRNDIFLMISSELFESESVKSSREYFYETFSYLISDFEKYIYRYVNHIDDILSWAYQYVNKLSLDSGLESTQFFTEKYMIDYLTNDIAETSTANSVYFDPACGGGNFLSHILSVLFVLRYQASENPIVCIKNILNILYGYELDSHLAMVASVNLKLKAMMLLNKVQAANVSDWNLFCPNIFTSIEPNVFGFLATNFSAHEIKRVSDGKKSTLQYLSTIATAIYTNPPFQTVKGMADCMKKHLKEYFPNARCDLCNAFVLQCINKIQPEGTIGIITQTSWMYLDSFESLRKEVITNNTIKSIADLGSGAFYDLSGEKANVALVRIAKTYNKNKSVKVLSLRDVSLKEKEAILSNASDLELSVQQTQLFCGEHSAFSLSNPSQTAIYVASEKYSNYAIPMQGTSTGDATNLIGYYWEHLNDSEWIPVSKGGGYSRWCGLNSYVLKWGTDGEYIRATKGSALRNTKYFDRTSLVYSDIGTSGFNARLLENGQLFVASGPGIRDIVGSPYAHLALLNSRVFSYFLRVISPKLTVAAGYISRVPVPNGLLDQIELDRLGQECYNRKKEQLKVRPNNLEWQPHLIDCDSLDVYVYRLFVKEMQDELVKLECEKKLDDIILKAYALDDAELSRLVEVVGVSVMALTENPQANSLDKSIAQALDSNCQIVRNRANKQSLGCDGILEFIARKEQVSPQKIVDLVSSSPKLFIECRNKYKDLVLHNIVLTILAFRLEIRDAVHMTELRQKFYDMYPGLRKEWNMVEGWILSQFNAIHTRAFSNRPYYRYEDGSLVRNI